MESHLNYDSVTCGRELSHQVIWVCLGKLHGRFKTKLNLVWILVDRTSNLAGPGRVLE
jgi:hypothetical protein